MRSKELLMMLVALTVFASGCAHRSTKDAEGAEVSAEAETSTLTSPTGMVREVPSFKVSDPEPATVANEELDGIPVEINSKVEQWIAYFQGRGRPHMERYLARSGRYGPLMKRILKQNGLPEDLIYIALIESGFSSKATSRAAAVGYWQFIRGTGKRYGLEINSFVDERRDPVLSTQAAADYFKGLYSVFGSWYLAMASYNVGENRVYREVMRNKTRNFWELVQMRRLPKETMNYVPKYIAAKLIGKNPEKYGFTNIEYEPPVEFELIRVSNAVNLRMMAEKMNMGYDEIKQLNPKFKGEVAPAKSSGVLELRVPLGQSAVAQVAARESIVEKIEFVADAGETETYRVRPGDSLYTIARKYKTTVAWLRDVNDLRPGRKLKVGLRIQVPDRSAKRAVVAKKSSPSPAPASTTTTQNDSAEIVTEAGVLYVVQPGDSLYSIAEEYDSTVAELLRMNKMKKGSVLHVGLKLKVPKATKLPQEPGEEGSTGRAQKQQEPAVTPESSAPAPEGTPAGTSRRLSNAGRAVVGAKPVLSESQRMALQRLRTRPDGSSLVPPQRLPQPSRVAVKEPRLRNQRAATKVHVVRPGENLTRIASKYRVSVRSLAAKNRLAKNSNHVTVGRRLQIPTSND